MRAFDEHKNRDKGNPRDKQRERFISLRERDSFVIVGVAYSTIRYRGICNIVKGLTR